MVDRTEVTVHAEKTYDLPYGRGTSFHCSWSEEDSNTTVPQLRQLDVPYHVVMAILQNEKFREVNERGYH